MLTAVRKAAARARHVRLRPAPAAATLLLAFAGAALGAVLDPTTPDRFRSESVVSIQAPDAGAATAAWHTLAASLRVPAVLSDIRTTANTVESGRDLADKLEAVGDPRSTFLRIRARGPSQAEADALADAAARLAVEAAVETTRRSLVPPGVNVSFGFEQSPQDWDGEDNIFPARPARIGLTRTSPFSGDAALRIRCPTATFGCGPAVQLLARFEGRTSYTAEGRLRSPTGAPVRARLVLGSSATDVRAGRTVTLTERWTKLSVAWVPRRATFAAELAVQAAAQRPFDLDAVDLYDHRRPRAHERRQRASAQRVREQAAATADRFTVASRAQAVPRAPAGTARSALLGGLVGLLAGLAGSLAERAARRRKPQHEPGTDVEPVTGELRGDHCDPCGGEGPD